MLAMVWIGGNLNYYDMRLDGGCFTVPLEANVGRLFPKMAKFCLESIG